MKDRNITFRTFASENKLIIVLFSVLLIGILIGSLAFRSFSSEELSSLSVFAQGFIENRANKSSSQILSQAFFSGTAMLLVAYVSGLCAIAQPVEFIIPLIKGLGLGASVAQIYAIKSVKGIGIVFLLIVPYAAMTCFVYLVAIKESVRYSNKLFSVTFLSGHNEGLKVYTKMYCLKFAFLEIIIVIASFVDWMCTILFAGMLL